MFLKNILGIKKNVTIFLGGQIKATILYPDFPAPSPISNEQSLNWSCASKPLSKLEFYRCEFKFRITVGGTDAFFTSAVSLDTYDNSSVCFSGLNINHIF